MSEVKVEVGDNFAYFDDCIIGGKKQKILLNSYTERSVNLIYIYSLTKLPLHGYKIGFTKSNINKTYLQSVIDRIREQKDEIALKENYLYNEYGLDRTLEYVLVAITEKGHKFKDYDIHRFIKNKFPSNITKNQEWFTGSIFSLAMIVNTIKEYRINPKKYCEVYELRNEQNNCVNKLFEYFNSKPSDNRFLVNAKMRFGKCLTMYKYAELRDFSKILILTYVPAVEESWREDLLHINKEYDYYTDEDISKKLFTFNTENFVLFLSLQNTLGKAKNSNEVKEKVSQLKNIDFDLLILDEYHFGAWNDRSQEKIEEIIDYDKALDSKEIIEHFSIKAREIVALSGTPFKAIARGEFNDNNTYSYTYFDEQKNKRPKDDEPQYIDRAYAHFPDMKIYGYNIGGLFGSQSEEFLSSKKIYEQNYFSFLKFFETEHDKDKNKDYIFTHSDEVKLFLMVLRGVEATLESMPYHKAHLNYNKHSLWLLPSVSSCNALETLLNEDEFFSKYSIINLSSNQGLTGIKCLEYLNKEMKKGIDNNSLGSIALTVNKLTLGVSVPKWTTVLVLKDLTSAEQYFQSIFRIQTPLVEDDKVKKEVCRVYDFIIDRAAKLIIEYGKSINSMTTEKLNIPELIVKYLPIYKDGFESAKVTVETLITLAEFADVINKPLSRRITNTELTTNLQLDNISNMLADPECAEVINSIFKFVRFKEVKNREKNGTEASDDILNSQFADAHRLGYEQGKNDYELYINLFDFELDEKIDCAIDIYCRKQFVNLSDYEYRICHNAYTKGFEKGINYKCKNLKIGEKDGLKFLRDVVRKKLGENIEYKSNTKEVINTIINKHLNDNSNLPDDVKTNKLRNKHYKESFKNAVIREIKPEADHKSYQDAHNAIVHILARIVQFLYISVYRECSFNEIFTNADPDVFKSAIGISKDQFLILNKYNIFQEKTLDSYILEFFRNESLGAKLDINEIENDNYRNSFNWFDFGIERIESIKK